MSVQSFTGHSQLSPHWILTPPPNIEHGVSSHTQTCLLDGRFKCVKVVTFWCYGCYYGENRTVQIINVYKQQMTIEAWYPLPWKSVCYTLSVFMVWGYNLHALWSLQVNHIQTEIHTSHYYTPVSCSPDFTVGSNESKIRAIIIALVPWFFGTDFWHSNHDISAVTLIFDVVVMTLYAVMTSHSYTHRKQTKKCLPIANFTDRLRHDSWR